MNEADTDKTYDAMQAFLTKVRRAYREMRAELNDEQFDFIVYPAQDRLSLFSPWMNSDKVDA